MVAGPSYSFKSFLVIDWLMNMVTGRNWNGRPTQVCKVAYALGEGKSSLLKRVYAWVKHNNLTDDEIAKIDMNFRVTFMVPQMALKSSTDNFLADLETEQFKPDVVVVDTFARSFVGLDENDQKDTGMWIESADRLRQNGYTVIFLHHTKKNTEFGVQYRGSTTIMGAMDTAMTLVRTDHTCTLTINKQKDHDEGKPLRFRRQIVPLSSVKGDDSVVLVPIMDIDTDLTPSEFELERPISIDIDSVIDELVKDQTFTSDRARARTLAKRTGMTEGAAQARISRFEKKGKL